MNEPIHERLTRAASQLTSGRVTVGQLAEVHGLAAPGAWVLLMAAPCLLPIPGMATVLSLGLSLLAFELWRGRVAVPLPARVVELELPHQGARRVLLLLAAFYRLADRIASPRLPRVAESEKPTWVALAIGWLALLILLPIPFGNILPALCLIILGLGLVFRDGLLILLAMACAAANTVLMAALGWQAWRLAAGV